ncbi:MAG: hypothetical protein ACXW3Z_04480 [Limisphaerales bacterium]
MKTNPVAHNLALSISLMLASFCGGAYAQNFDNGSTGALGDVVYAENATIDLPPDGKLHYNTLVVNSGVTVSFTRNVLNTPVYILAKGQITISGTIDVSGSASPNNIPTGGLGGPGGFDGGKPGFNDFAPGAGYGPGGARGGDVDANSATGAGSGSFRTVSGSFNNPNKGATYGSPMLIPLVGGSGGGGTVGSPGRGGGGGGGAILVSSNVRIHLTGRILASGGQFNSSSGNGGSGGAVRLVSPVVSGSGEINVLAPNDWAGRGRIRIDTIDRSDLRYNFQPVDSLSVGANLFIFPQPLPRLDVVTVAGTAIAEGSGPAQIQLPFGSSPERTVTVRAQNWGRVVPIRVVLIPDSGAPIAVDSEINNTTQNPAEVAVPVVLPVNNLVTIQVWTR